MPRSDLYLRLLPAIDTPGQIELLDNRRLVSQTCALERRTARSGKDSVDHPLGGHDDVINAAALSLVFAALAPRSSAANWLEYYRRLSETAAAPAPPPSLAGEYSNLGFMQPLSRRAAGDLVRVVVPAEQWPSTVIGASGASYVVHVSGKDRFLMMLPEDAKALVCSPIPRRQRGKGSKHSVLISGSVSVCQTELFG
jgi:hypothetical protein